MKELLLGNEAIARGAYEAGVRVAAAYPGTPSSEITANIAKYPEMYAEWSPNEKVSLEVVAGASVAGARAICAMKHVGLNVAADPLFTASYTGVNGGMVICVADDPGMHSSQNEQDSRHHAIGSKTMMLEPSDSQECKDFVIKGFTLSEEYDTPVLIRLSTRISHSRGIVELGPRNEVPIKKYVKDMPKYVMMPATARLRHPIVEKRLANLAAYAETTDLNKVEYHDKKIGVITSGVAYQYARQALGDNASYLKLGMVYPLPVKLIADFVKSVETCYVVEELDPVIETHCKALGLPVIGKGGKFSLLGEYDAVMIKEAILGEKTETLSLPEAIPARPPVLCAGCAHRGVFHVLREMNLLVTGDIGCYTLGALPPTNSMDTCLCMGAAVSMAHGMEKALGRENSRNVLAVIGDSTFVHSGITGLIDIVYNKSASTVMILDNITTGMTGHQEHPSTGKTIKGEPTHQLDLEALCRAVGVNRVYVVDATDLKAVEDTLRQALNEDEPSVVIARKLCKLIDFDPAPVFTVNRDACTGCGICLQIGCPALSRSGDNYTIDKDRCGGCRACAQVCKFEAIEEITV
jgi:indolepyruvate ferredoxin oxidoreductase alpha subunit